MHHLNKLDTKMALLEVKDLKVRVEEREILHGLTLTVNEGEIHAIMGPNGSGKSTLSHVIAGKPGYEVTDGEILFKGEDLLAMAPNERAAKGVFLAFQYPVEIPGVSTMNFLRTALNAQRKARGEGEYSTPDFLKKVREVSKSLNIPQDMLKRGVNVGFSGGEKKRNEVLQMALFEPSLCILDEMDSGLDIDALRIAADGVNALHSPKRAMVVITHYQRLLNYIVPDVVHVMSKRPCREERRQGTGAGAGSVRLRPVRGRRVRNFEMNVAVAKTGNGRAVSDLFASAEGRLPGSPSVIAVRREAFETYERLGLPHRRIEEWKYTDLRALVGEVLPLAAAPDATALKRAADAVKAHAITGARKLVLVDGVFAPDLSDVKALASEAGFKTLRETLEKDSGLLKDRGHRCGDRAERRDGDRRCRASYRRRHAAVRADPDHSHRGCIFRVGFHPLAGCGREGRSCHDHRELCRGRRQGLPGQRCRHPLGWR
ncbi:FeS assembly ATPase SufC [Bradyrhizobium sp. GM6.1]